MAKVKYTDVYTIPTGTVPFVLEYRKPTDKDVTFPNPTLWYDAVGIGLYLKVFDDGVNATWEQMPIGYEKKFLFTPSDLKGWRAKLVNFIFRS